jgi:hypothetical protein
MKKSSMLWKIGIISKAAKLQCRCKIYLSTSTRKQIPVVVRRCYLESLWPQPCHLRIVFTLQSIYGYSNSSFDHAVSLAIHIDQAKETGLRPKLLYNYPLRRSTMRLMLFGLLGHESRRWLFYPFLSLPCPQARFRQGASWDMVREKGWFAEPGPNLLLSRCEDGDSKG